MSDPVDLIARKTLEFEIAYNGHSSADSWDKALDSTRERHVQMAQVAVQTVINWANSPEQEPVKRKMEKERRNEDYVLGLLISFDENLRELIAKVKEGDSLSDKASKFRVRHKFTGRTGIVMSEKDGMYTIEWDGFGAYGRDQMVRVSSKDHVHPADEFDKISMHPVPAYEMRPNAMVYEVLDHDKDRRK